MTPVNFGFKVNFEEYHRFRREIGSQAKVAALLGINIRTLQRREAGEIPLNPEAQRSMRALYASLRMENLTQLIVEWKPLVARGLPSPTGNIRSAVKELADLLA